MKAEIEIKVTVRDGDGKVSQVFEAKRTNVPPLFATMRLREEAGLLAQQVEMNLQEQ